MALSLEAGPQSLHLALPRAARRIRRVLRAAALPLGPDRVRSVAETATVLARWYHAHVGYGPLRGA